MEPGDDNGGMKEAPKPAPEAKPATPREDEELMPLLWPSPQKPSVSFERRQSHPPRISVEMLACASCRQVNG